MRSAFILIFAVALLLRLWFNFFVSCGSAAFACDAAEYLRHAQNMDTCLNSLFLNQPYSFIACLNIFSGNATTNEIALVKQIFLPLQSMSISGPVFPAFLLVCYKLFGQNPSLELWQTPIFIQSILCALTATLIASIGNSCWNKQTGITAGIIAALYPGFIINSGRLYSESFAYFLLCLILWLLVSYLTENNQHYLWGILLGACLFSLQATRSIMTLISVAAGITFTLSCVLHRKQVERPTKYLIAILIGFCICMLPWLAIQKLAFGKTSLIVDRSGKYNFFIGNNVDGLGWISVPYPDLEGVEKQNYTTLLKQAEQRSPERFFKLMLDKPIRLFKLPWNDFRVSLGPISVGAQVLFHQLILIFAAIGLFISFSQSNEYLKQPKYLARFIVLFIFLLHLIYLAFSTIPRYAITAMPEMILFAATGLLSTFASFKLKTSRTPAKYLAITILLIMAISKLDLAVVLSQTNGENILPTLVSFWMTIILKMTAVLLFFIACWQLLLRTVSALNQGHALVSIFFVALIAVPAYCLPLRAHGRWYEWSKDFQDTGKQIERTIILNQELTEKLKNHEAYLAVNIQGGSNLATDWNFSINNTKISGPFIPAMALAQDLTLVHLDSNRNLTIEQESILKSLCNVTSRSPLDLRQWYLIPITPNKWHTILTSSSNSNKPVAQPEALTALHITLSKCAVSSSILYGTTAINNNYSLIPSLFRFSWDKAFYGAENEDGLSDPAYDQKIKSNQTLSSNNENGVYIKLLIPELMTIVRGHKIVMNTPPSLLRLEEAQSTNSDILTGTSSISFKPKSALFHSNSKDAYCIIRLVGTIDSKHDKKASVDRQETIVWPRIIFADNINNSEKQQPLAFVTPWLPNYAKPDASSKSSALKFDICFPLLISAFPKPAQNIEVHFAKSGIHDGKIAHLNCCLEIYRMSRLLSGAKYEIL